jgi:uncharacterized membrane protein (UPF0127 family)
LPATTSAALASGSTSTEPPEVSPEPPSSFDQGDLAGWETARVAVAGIELLVAVADDSGERSVGLVGVDQLGDLDGMLFRFSEEAITGFWMRGTLIPLDIAFFGDDQVMVDMMSMTPCEVDPCPAYVPDAPFAWALEVPSGTLGSLPEGTKLEIGE